MPCQLEHKLLRGARSKEKRWQARAVAERAPPGHKETGICHECGLALHAGPREMGILALQGLTDLGQPALL